MRFILITGSVLFLAACATIPIDAPLYSRAKDAPPHHQNVYIYRLNAVPILRTPTVSIDGVPVFDPPENAYTVLALPEGLHLLTAKWSWDVGFQRGLVLTFTVTPTEPLYIRISGLCNVAMLGGGGYRLCSSLQIIPQSQAEYELAYCCRYIAPNRQFQSESAIR